jgi:tetratricopeptide (TPR) repeat protein
MEQVFVAEAVQSIEGSTPRWRDVWQLPLLGAATLVLAAGLVAAVVTAPKPDLSAGLGDAQRQMDAHKYADALQTLNDRVLPALNNGLTPEQKRQFHIQRAQCLYLGQKELSIDRPENNRAIVSEYGEAERLNALLEPKDAVCLATTLLSLGEVDLAVRRAQGLPEDQREPRAELLRRAVELSIRSAPPNYTRALDLVTYLSADPRTNAEDRAWLLARQAEVLLAQGYAGEAVTKIVRTLPRLDGATAPLLGEIHYRLAKAYEAQNELEAAVKQLDRAAELLDSGSSLIPALTLLQAEIYHKKPALGNARERYSVILSKYSFSDELAAALLGMGEVEAESVLGLEAGTGERSDPGPDVAAAIDRSLDHYTKLVDLLRAGGKAGELKRERIGESLLSRFREQYEGKQPDYGRALRYVSLGEQLFGIDATPSDLLLAMAQVHRKLAEELLSAAGAGGPLSLADADPATQREARDHLIRSGEYFRTHASRIVQASTTQYGESLWSAADAFDRAGDTDACIGAFQQFAADFPGDTRHSEACFRLAQAYQARGDLDLAAGVYRDLIDSRGRSEQTGPFADASYVPLAQTLLADASEANDAEAENLLLAVVNGSLGGTRTAAFRAALRELGQHYYQSKRYERAIERFEEYLQRATTDVKTDQTPADEGPPVEANAASALPPESAAAPLPERTGATPALPDDPGADTVRYKLADCYRLSAIDTASRLVGGAMPDGERRELEKTRDARLTKAGDLFDQVRAGLEAKKRRTALEDLYMRNASFYRADCAFDLKDYAGAIAHYDAARERYPKDPASLVAMTQIVSALLAQGDVKKAEIANRRAMLFYQSLPPTVWEDASLPITQKDWQRWLDAQAELFKVSKTAGAEGPRPE